MIPISLPPSAPQSVLAAVADATQSSTSAGERPALRDAANAFEAVFLTEMLSHAGMGASGGGIGDGGFDGGVGEDAFSSLLTREWASKLSEQGGLGLSDAIYRSLLARENGHG